MNAMLLAVLLAAPDAISQDVNRNMDARSAFALVKAVRELHADPAPAPKPISPCSPECVCGCNETGVCTCGNASTLLASNDCPGGICNVRKGGVSDFTTNPCVGGRCTAPVTQSVPTYRYVQPAPIYSYRPVQSVPYSVPAYRYYPAPALVPQPVFRGPVIQTWYR